MRYDNSRSEPTLTTTNHDNHHPTEHALSEQPLTYPTLGEKPENTAGARRYRRVIDAHMHWYPQAFVDLMIRKGPANGAVMGEDSNGNPVVISVPDCTQRSVMRKTMTHLDDIIRGAGSRLKARP